MDPTNKNTNVFFDSGAFSVKSYNSEPISIDNYIEFIKKYEPYMSVYANLDVIGDADATWENQWKMEAAGLNPLPIYHAATDDVKYLKRCMDNYEYFAVGGIAHNPNMQERIRVLDKCWHYIVDDQGKPQNKIHGLGLAAPQLIYRYPWYSIDTSSYMDYGQYGIIIMPKKRANGFDYNTAPVKVFVTARSPKKAKDGTHFDNLSRAEQDAVLEYLHDRKIQYGTSEFKEVEKGYKPEKGVEVFANNERTLIERPVIEGVCNTNFYRDLINFIYYMDIAEQLGPYKNRRFKVSKADTLF